MQYNAILRALNTEKLGISKLPFQIRSLHSLREDGGEISMIDVIVLKKSNFYYFDVLNKKRLSVEKFEKLYGGCDDEGTSRKLKEKKVILNFRITAVDTLTLYDFIGKNKKGKNIQLKKSLERNFKKCIIEFGNTEEVYQSISASNIILI